MQKGPPWERHVDLLENQVWKIDLRTILGWWRILAFMIIKPVLQVIQRSEVYVSVEVVLQVLSIYRIHPNIMEIDVTTLMI